MLSLAIISVNKNQYSETFIHNHVKLLPATIHFLFGGYLPDKYSIDKGLTAYDITGYKKPGILNAFKSEKDKLLSDVECYIHKNNIDAILCEYGPSGVEMMHIAKKLNIPLIVHFHGFDAYRNDVLSFYGPHYPQLFSIASRVIGVSKHMCRQLAFLGCPPEKINYLPYGIDTEIFKFSEHSGNQMRFVSCGRFVEKKAPQLIIKAFDRLLKKRPDVTLTMIGDGELLDECRQLVKDLDIEGSVEFTGALPQQEIADVFSKSFAFLQHSITTAGNDSEGTPLTIMEAMASGLPVVATKHAGITDVISGDALGFLIEEKDFAMMSEKMLYLAEHPEIALKTGKAGSEHISSHYNLPAYTSKLYQLINKQLT